MVTKTNPVVILVSSDFEWKIIKSALFVSKRSQTPFGEISRAKLGQRELLFLHGGWGKIAAAASTQYAIDHLDPEILINIGTCGSFHQSMKRGDVLLAEKTIVYDITEQMGDPDEAIGAYTTEMDTSWIKSLRSVHPGVLISADRDIVQADIQELRSKYNAAAADWESGSIAWTAKQNEVPLLILRGVSDVVSEDESLAYGDLSHFEEGVGIVMQRLLGMLPECLDLWEKNTKR